MSWPTAMGTGGRRPDPRHHHRGTEATTKTKPIPDHRNKPMPPCTRCGCDPGDHRWAAITQSACGVMVEMRLCRNAFMSFQTFIANGTNLPVTNRKEPDRFASVSPPAGLGRRRDSSQACSTRCVGSDNRIQNHV